MDSLQYADAATELLRDAAGLLEDLARLSPQHADYIAMWRTDAAALLKRVGADIDE